jgi:transcriptional regulator of acetoin/glycerol metabolism
MSVKRPGISKDAMILLKGYDWPGNVRELENVIERAMVLSQGDRIDREHFSLRLRKNLGKEKRRIISIKQGFKEMIEAALEETNGNISAAVQNPNIARSTLYRKIKEFDIVT